MSTLYFFDPASRAIIGSAMSALLDSAKYDLDTKVQGDVVKLTFSAVYDTAPLVAMKDALKALPPGSFCMIKLDDEQEPTP